jgi:putative zinc finger protein
MNCERIKEQFSEYWSGSLETADRAAVQAHLDSCASCQMEAENLGRIWETLGHFPEPKPTPQLRARFSETLAAYQLGMASAKRKEKPAPWWQFRPVFQFGLAAAMLAIGVAGGHLFTATRQSASQVAELRQELAGMRHMVTLSLLQQQSATDRLRGVTWSVRATTQDTDVLSALLYTLGHDSSVNVRLAAADALHSFTDSPLVRRALPAALGRQDSPLVQVALIDLLSDISGRDVDEALRNVSADTRFMEPVRDRARKALKTRQGEMQ